MICVKFYHFHMVPRLAFLGTENCLRGFCSNCGLHVMHQLFIRAAPINPQGNMIDINFLNIPPSLVWEKSQGCSFFQRGELLFLTGA